MSVRTQVGVLSEPRYSRIRIRLEGSQPKVVELGFPADYIAFIDVSQIDPGRVYVAFNEPMVFLPLSNCIVVDTRGYSVITRLIFRWEPDQEGRDVEIYYSGAPTLRIGANIVIIGGDYVGLLKASDLRVPWSNDVWVGMSSPVTGRPGDNVVSIGAGGTIDYDVSGKYLRMITVELGSYEDGDHIKEVAVTNGVERIVLVRNVSLSFGGAAIAFLSPRRVPEGHWIEVVVSLVTAKRMCVTAEVVW